MTEQARVDDADLVVEGLSVSTTAGVEIVRDVSLRIGPGDTLGLIGESGSGKTTVGLAALGHVQPGLEFRSGSVVLRGHDLLRMEARRLRSIRGSEIAYLPQDARAALNPRVRLGRQSMLFLDRDSMPSGTIEHFEELLDQVGLPTRGALAGRYPHELSGGQLQRLTLALAFSSRPALIVLDEPTTALDSVSQGTALGLMKRLIAAEGARALYVSHDMGTVEQLCSSVAVMYSGEIVEAGSVEQTLRSPVHPYTRGLVAAIPTIESPEPPRGIPGVALAPHDRRPGCNFFDRCPLASDECRAVPHIAMRQVAGRDVRCCHAEVSGTAWLGTPRPVDVRRPAPTGADDGGLRVEGLRVVFGDTPVLHGVDLRIGPGERVALLGESGSGKSTLARSVIGLISDYQGGITLDGVPLARRVGDRSADELRRVQYIWQNPYSSLNPRRRIRDILRQPADQFFDYDRDHTRELIAQTIEAVGLSPRHLGKFPRQLSGGERQRVAIARALMAEPDFLICDEITSALDVSVQASVVRLMRRLGDERGIGFLFISHQLALVRHLVDEVHILQHGRLVESGRVEQIFNAPQHPYTTALISAAS